MKNERIIKSFTIGDTFIQLTKGERNLTDYTVSCEDTTKDTYACVTYGHFHDANQAFGTAFSQALGEDDDLKALLGVKPTLEWE